MGFLKRDWEPAEATVIDKAMLETSRLNTNGAAKPRFKYVLEITPATGEAFRCEVHDPLFIGDFVQPGPGDTAAVRFDPKSHKAKFDLHAPGALVDRYTAEKSQKAQFDASLDAPPGEDDRRSKT